ncbi:MAG: alpha/beta fold hydrolase [Burkholderiaceae bacterium]
MPATARVSVAGIDIRFDGDSPHTVVMVHGWPDSYRLWEATVDALKGHFCCVRFTLPGFDVDAPARATSLDDMCEWLLTVVDQVSPGLPVTLLLHDWGCVFGYEFAARHPDRVSRIIAVDIGDHNSAALRQALTFKQTWQVFAYQIWLALAWKLGGQVGTRMTRWQARALGCRTDPSHIGWQMNYPYAMQWFGSGGGLAHLAPVRPTCPVLYIYGTRKPFMFHSPQWLAALSARPDCAVKAFATGHWVMLQQPQAFHGCVLDWLTDAESAG